MSKEFIEDSNIFDLQIRGEKFKLITEANTITYFYDYLVTYVCWKQFEKVITM